MSRLIFLLALFVGNIALAAPDCAEKKITIEDLQTLVSSGKIKTMQQFLEAIPKDALQTFTFVTNSLSLHRGNEQSDKNGQGKVTTMWPRVLRSSADGKITISFVCDPKNPSYGKVETLYFDEQAKQLKSVEWDFKDPVSSHTDRIHSSPKSCVACHAASTINNTASLKYNWGQYPSWSDCQRDRGIVLYGGNDDNLSSVYPRLDISPVKNNAGCTPQKYGDALTQEIKDYKNFRQKQANNECFNTLPWLQGTDSKEKAVYPYGAGSYGSSPYSLRPNLRITTNYAHLTAKQLTQEIEKGNPQRFNLMKYYLVMEKLGCLSAADKANIQSLTGQAPPPPPKWSVENGGLDAADAANVAPYLYATSKAAGLSDRDWTLEFKDPSSLYNPGYSPLADLVAGNILKELAESDSKISAASKQAFISLPGQDGVYGDSGNYSCVDRTGQAIKAPVRSFGVGLSDVDRLNLCSALHTANDKNFDSSTAQQSLALESSQCSPKPSGSSPILNVSQVAAHATVMLDQTSVDRGRRLVQPNSKGKCIMCHSAGATSGLPPDYRFVPNEKAPKKEYDESIAVLRARQQEGFANTLQVMLVESKAMPPIENTLSDQDRADIAAYINSLAH